MRTANIIAAFVLLILGSPFQASAGDQWHYQSSIEVPSPGLIEAVLPPGLFFSADAATPASNLDLSLIGPDGKQRSFEIYWKEENSIRKVVLESSRVYADKAKGLIWEAAPPKNFQIEDILIDFATRQGMGKVTIEGKDSDGWHLLAENAALYQAEDRSKADIHIKAGVYAQLRLCFRGYDREYRETPFLVKSVTLSGKSIAKDYVEKTIGLDFTDDKHEQERIITALLPGSGLWARTVTLFSDAQFQGKWKLGQYAMTGGKMEFQELLSGDVTTVGRAASNVEIQVNRSWPGRSLVLKLDTAGKYLGNIRELRINTHLPRLVFLADTAGVYLAQSGLGNKAIIRELPGDKERKISREISFSEIIENRSWRPESLVEKFSIEGGPFNEKGYSWMARVKISAPGYYRLVLSREAGLSPNTDSIRLVREGAQVPYFKGHNEIKEIDLQITSDYDKGKNITASIIKLPVLPDRGIEMIIESFGIFERRALIEIPRPGNTGWKAWKNLSWQNLTNTPALLHVSFEGLPTDVTEMRVTINHGDNRPIELKKVRAAYNAPTLLFLINRPGEYTLFGGNRETPSPKYDLNLVQAHLMEAVPKPALMEELVLFRSSELKYRFLETFDDKSWGLYAVLALVTLVLMILIIRLFPKEKKEGTDQH